MAIGQWQPIPNAKPTRLNGRTLYQAILIIKRGDVSWVEFDPALGSEIKKTRPAIIVSNDSANRHLTRVIVVPLTSNTERLYPGEALVTLSDQPSKAMADQIMTVDKRRLKSKIATLTKSDLRDVEDAILVQLGLPK